MADRESLDIERAAKRVFEAKDYLRIDKKIAELAVLDDEIAKPGFWDDLTRAQDLSKNASALRDTIAEYEKAAGLLDDTKVALDLASEDDAFCDEAAHLFDKLESLLDDLEIASWFSGRFDAGDAILTVNPGSGGLEAQDWTEMLYRMFSRYAEKKGWKVRILDLIPGVGIGLDKAMIQIEGYNAYGMLRSESGVHRLVRISPTDDKKRRHTTFAGVEVSPVLPDDIEVELNDADVRVDVYRSSGPGGQSVNTTDSAVRLTHAPTGIVVTCQNEKSQTQNKEAARKVLKSKLYELAELKRQAELAELRGERMDNSFGSQIRNYVLYPYQLVKDVRSNIETGNVEAVLDGDIDDFVIGYHRWRVSQGS
ncbi:MAG: peptide chain release factor 2 [Eggerthellaceae bacterium]|nr:peptide chain release factor 2 [Eggerthellaceae bacterium]